MPTVTANKTQVPLAPLLSQSSRDALRGIVNGHDNRAVAIARSVALEALAVRNTLRKYGLETDRSPGELFNQAAAQLKLSPAEREQATQNMDLGNRRLTEGKTMLSQQARQHLEAEQEKGIARKLEAIAPEAFRKLPKSLQAEAHKNNQAVKAVRDIMAELEPRLQTVEAVQVPANQQEAKEFMQTVTLQDFRDWYENTSVQVNSPTPTATPADLNRIQNIAGAFKSDGLRGVDLNDDAMCDHLVQCKTSMKEAALQASVIQQQQAQPGKAVNRVVKARSAGVELD